MRTARKDEITALAPITRRRRSKEERRRIVEETLAGEASVSVIARAHDVNANQVFHWRKLYREGRLETEPANLLPVRIAETGHEDRRQVRQPIGAIHLEIGAAKIRIEGAADPVTLRAILEQFSR